MGVVSARILRVAARVQGRKPKIRRIGVSKCLETIDGVVHPVIQGNVGRPRYPIAVVERVHGQRLGTQHASRYDQAEHGKETETRETTRWS